MSTFPRCNICDGILSLVDLDGERGKGGKGEDLLKDSWHDFGILKKKKYRTDTYLDQYSLRILEILWKLLATTGSGFIKFVYA